MSWIDDRPLRRPGDQRPINHLGDLYTGPANIVQFSFSPLFANQSAIIWTPNTVGPTVPSVSGVNPDIGTAAASVEYGAEDNAWVWGANLFCNFFIQPSTVPFWTGAGSVQISFELDLLDAISSILASVTQTVQFTANGGGNTTSSSWGAPVFSTANPPPSFRGFKCTINCTNPSLFLGGVSAIGARLYATLPRNYLGLAANVPGNSA